MLLPVVAKLPVKFPNVVFFVSCDCVNVFNATTDVFKLAVVASIFVNLLFVEDVYELNDALLAKDAVVVCSVFHFVSLLAVYEFID